MKQTVEVQATAMESQMKSRAVRNGKKSRMRSFSRRIRESINTRIRCFFGGFRGLQVVSKDFAPYQTTNVGIMLKEYFEKEVSVRKILGVKEIAYGFSATNLLAPATYDKVGYFRGADSAPPTYTRSVPESIDARLGLADVVIFFECEGVRMAACAVTLDRYADPCISLSVISRDVAKADRLLSLFCEYENRHSIFRGRMIRLQIDCDDAVKEAEILERSPLSWDQLVLPDEICRELQENIVGYIRSADAMAANGIEAKRGILFHGVPGTGKTFLCNLLSSELEGFTTILCSGVNLERPSGVFTLARRFTPSLILFEDIDLVGSKREGNQSLTVLSTIMNELDGIHKLERVYALFTTNRIEAIEEALSQRPGRIDVVVELPLPSPELRARLLRLYAGKAALRLESLDPILRETEGVSPAFLKELMKRAVYIAVRSGTTTDGGVAVVEDRHVAQALAELKRVENRAARRIIGF